MIRGRTLVAGEAAGEVVALEPLSFWGGFDAVTGRVTDRSHPAHGLSLAGVVLVMRTGRGSSSSSSVLAEAIRLRTAPAAIVLAAPDAILAVGAQVAATLYDLCCPVVTVTDHDHARLAAATWIGLTAAADGAEIMPFGSDEAGPGRD